MQSDRSYNALSPVVHGDIVLSVNTLQYKYRIIRPMDITETQSALSQNSARVSEIFCIPL